jgi:type IV pilus assembly protein PilV
MTRFKLNRPARTRGFTLVEVLVALVVLSIGLLGIASLQLSSLRWNHGASLRSQATLLAYDIVDRMRANQIAANAGDYDAALGAATGAAGSVSLADKIRWKTLLSQTLPSGDGTVQRTVISTTTTTFRITIQWDDSHSSVNNAAIAADQTMTFVLETQI